MLDRPLPVTLTVCHHLLVDDRAAHAPDVRRHELPAVRALGRRHGLGEYVTAPLRRPDGSLLGSLCGWSASPAVAPDPAGTLRRLEAAADHLSARFAAALEAAADDRRADRERALRSADPVTALPDRRGWGQLLQDEEERALQLAAPVSVVLVDVGTVRTARGLRRAGDVLREAAGDVAVARVSGSASACWPATWRTRPAGPAGRRGPGRGRLRCRDRLGGARAAGGRGADLVAGRGRTGEGPRRPTGLTVMGPDRAGPCR